MLKTAILLAVVTGVTIMAKTVYRDIQEESRYFNYVASGKFLTETYNKVAD